MTDVKFDRRALAALLTAPEVTRDLEERAERVKDRAASSAPTGTGALARSHRVVTDVSPDGRARVRVVAETDYAAIVGAETGYLGASLDAGKG